MRLLAVLALALLAHSTARAGEAELRAAIDTFGQAFARADVDYLREHVTEDYLHVNGGSGNVVERDAWLAWIGTQAEALERGELIIENYEVHSVQILMHGSTAAVTGIVESSGTRHGESFASRIRFSNTWLLREGKWLRAAFHDSALGND